MIPRSFQIAASFITSRLIQYHASLARVFTAPFHRAQDALTYEKVRRGDERNDVAFVVSLLLLLLRRLLLWTMFPFCMLCLRCLRRQVRALSYGKGGVNPGYTFAYINVYWASLCVPLCSFRTPCCSSHALARWYTMLRNDISWITVFLDFNGGKAFIITLKLGRIDHYQDKMERLLWENC